LSVNLAIRVPKDCLALPVRVAAGLLIFGNCPKQDETG
jgi:hypothetical protein